MTINWKKNAALFLIGQALSFFGTMVVQYAIIWHITIESKSGTMLTMVAIVGFLPMFFISPFAGVWVDRFNRKYIINIADGSVAFFSLIVAVLLVAGFNNYAILLVCAFVRAIGQGIQMPAVGAFIPRIVPEEQLTRINGFQSSIQSFVMLASPMLSGALMSVAPLEALFFLDVITAAIGISIVSFCVKNPAAEKAELQTAAGTDAADVAPREETPRCKETAYFYDLKEGLKYIMTHGYVLRMLALSALYFFLFTPVGFMTPLQVTRNFGEDFWRLSAIEIAFSAGMLAGGLFIGLWGGFTNRIYTMALACALSGILAVGLGMVPVFWLYLVIMGVMGLAVPFYNTPSMVLLQTTVEPAFMGRVISVFTMASSVMMPLGMLVFGPAADIISIDMILVVTGFSAALLCIPMMASKTLREAGVRHTKQQSAQ